MVYIRDNVRRGVYYQKINGRGVNHQIQSRGWLPLKDIIPFIPWSFTKDRNIKLNIHTLMFSQLIVQLTAEWAI